eukprot:scaffold109473_cov33-Tisochrysis_lutea.AAC.8
MAFAGAPGGKKGKEKEERSGRREIRAQPWGRRRRERERGWAAGAHVNREKRPTDPVKKVLSPLL